MDWCLLKETLSLVESLRVFKSLLQISYLNHRLISCLFNPKLSLEFKATIEHYSLHS